ncbi:hypothetical protein HBI57_046680 [Parastagonospora nodorum]|nr:hypothetical protein HBI57_046680 [Parastagonospora nodorum]KAH6479478.1 hypothetical protein HBI58_086650 [Parastagonospora nodorum]
MFTWITGPRITNVIEDLQPENNYESTFLEPAETPAHQFAVNAFKHALFGTPAPEDASNPSKRNDKKAKIDAANAKNIVITPPPDDGPLLSPSKQPGGILMTPGTASKGRKTVSFGSHVVDNEGKRGNIGKSGIPNDCPGKFPSPWTPGTQLKLEPGSDKRPRTKFTEALLNARTTTQPKSGQKPKAKDDSDITIDLGAPRSESGKYWKEQYESYAERSEKEMKKVIAKQQLAKKFAMKKDSEVTELTTKFEQERKKFRQRERELEQQNQDFQDRLSQAVADNTSATVEIAALKCRIAVLERSSSDSMQDKPPFQIFEDPSKDAIRATAGQQRGDEASFAPSVSMASSGKENHSPKPRRQHRQSVPDRSAQRVTQPRFGTSQGEVSIALGRSTMAPAKPDEQSPDVISAFIASEQIPRSPLQARKTEPAKENYAPNSPDAVLPSSPLPMPSPGIDPWMDLNNESSIQPVDKMAMPNYSSKPFSRPEWEPAPKSQRATKPTSQTKHAAPPKLEDRRTEKLAASEVKADLSTGHSRPIRAARDVQDRPSAATSSDNHCINEVKKTNVVVPKKTDAVTNHSPTDPKFDLSKITAHHAEGSSLVKKDRAEILPLDRKEQARKRLEERKRLRKNAPS